MARILTLYDLATIERGSFGLKQVKQETFDGNGIDLESNMMIKYQRPSKELLINTFAASYLNTQGLNNSCLKSQASTLVDLTFQSRALRSFSLNQLRNLSL